MKVYFDNEDEIKKFAELSSVESLKEHGDVYCKKTVYSVRFTFKDGWRTFETTTSVDDAIEKAKGVLGERNSVTVEISKYDDLCVL